VQHNTKLTQRKQSRNMQHVRLSNTGDFEVLGRVLRAIPRPDQFAFSGLDGGDYPSVVGGAVSSYYSAVTQVYGEWMRDTHESRGGISDEEVYGRIIGQCERSGVLRTIVQGVGERNGSASGRIQEYEVEVEKGQGAEDISVVSGVEQVEVVAGVGVSSKTQANRERRKQKREKKKHDRLG